MTNLTYDELLNLAGEVNRCTELYDVRLEAIESKSRAPEGVLMGWDVAINADALREAPEWTRVRSTYTITVWPAIESGDHAGDRIAGSDEFWSMRMSFIATFRTIPDAVLTDAQLAAFANSTGAMAIHPYARAEVQSLSSRIGYPSLTLPLLRGAIETRDDGTIDIDLDQAVTDKVSQGAAEKATPKKRSRKAQVPIAD